MANTAREADTIVADAVGDDLPNPVVDGELEQQTNTDFLARDDDFPPRKSVKVFQIYHFLSSQPLKYYLAIVKYNMAINRKFPFFPPIIYDYESASMLMFVTRRTNLKLLEKRKRKNGWRISSQP